MSKSGDGSMADCFGYIVKSITEAVPVIGYSPINHNLSNKKKQLCRSKAAEMKTGIKER